MGKHTGLAHLGHFRQDANAQAFEADLRRQAQGRINNRLLGLLPFLQHTATARADTTAGRLGFHGRVGNGHGARK